MASRMTDIPAHNFDASACGPDQKPTNPKDAVGISKAYQSVIPRPVLYEVGAALLEGALKYGRHNYRVAGIRASVYYDAVQRHLDAWWEGQDIDPESGLPHVVKAIAGLIVFRDAERRGLCTDDRPPAEDNPDWMQEMNRLAKALLEKYPAEVRKAPFTQQRAATIPTSWPEPVYGSAVAFSDLAVIKLYDDHGNCVSETAYHPEKLAALDECASRYGVPFEDA